MSLTGPFTLQRGLDAGLTERVLRGPAYRRLLHGVYAPVGVTPTKMVRARAALLLSPAGALVARHTAAALWGGHRLRYSVRENSDPALARIVAQQARQMGLQFVPLAGRR